MKEADSDVVDLTLVVLDGAYPTGVAVTLDLLRAASSLAAGCGAQAPTWRICSLGGGTVPLQGGLAVETDPLPLRARRDSSIWVVPGLGTVSATAVAHRLDREDARTVGAAVARHAGRGGRVAASCSAVFLLQPTGLLRGKRVTTTWWLAPRLQELEPACEVDADRMVCADGDLVTAGAAFAQTDLMLHLLREQCGPALTDAVSRSLLIDARQAQAPYVVPEVLANGDALVSRVVDLVEGAWPEPPSVAALAAELGVSERTLARKITAATGRSTLALVQSLKLRRARTLLEDSRMTVDQVAGAVGYQDATALRRAMQKGIGANPSRYRSR